MRTNTFIVPLLAYLPFILACGSDAPVRPTSDASSSDATLPLAAPSPDLPVVTLPITDLPPSPTMVAPVEPLADAGIPVSTHLGPSTFRIRNTGTETLFLRRVCDVQVWISPPSGEWQTTTLAPCACDCADLACVHVDCPGCPEPTIVPLAPGAIVEVAWLPRLSRRQRMAFDGGDPLCAIHQALPTGPYLAHVATYLTVDDATLGMNRQMIVRTFDLPPLPSILPIDLP